MRARPIVRGDPSLVLFHFCGELFGVDVSDVVDARTGGAQMAGIAGILEPGGWC